MSQHCDIITVAPVGGAWAKDSSTGCRSQAWCQAPHGLPKCGKPGGAHGGSCSQCLHKIARAAAARVKAAGRQHKLGRQGSLRGGTRFLRVQQFACLRIFAPRVTALLSSPHYASGCFFLNTVHFNNSPAGTEMPSCHREDSRLLTLSCKTFAVASKRQAFFL